MSTPTKHDRPALTVGVRLFVGGVPYRVTDDDLRAAFEQFGQLTDAFLVRDTQGMSKGYGFVEFADPAAAEQAMNELHGAEWDDRTMVVRPAVRRQESVER